MMKFFKSIFLLLASVTIMQAQISVLPTVTHLTSTSTPSAGAITLTVSGGTSPYSYTWTPGPVYTKDISNKTAQTYTVKVKDNSASTVSYTYNIGYKADWDQTQGCVFRNDTLLSTVGNGWSQALTKNTLAASTNGWFEYILKDMSHIKAIGFADSLSPILNTYADIDYGFYYDGSTSTLYRIVAGSLTAGTTTVTQGAALKVERSGTSIKFLVNGVVTQTLTNASAATKAWKVKGMLYNYILRTSFINVGCSFATKGNVTFKNYSAIIPYITHTSSLSATNGSIKVKPLFGGTYTYTWQPGSVASATLNTKAAGAYTLTADDASHNKTPLIYNIGYKCDWDQFDKTELKNDTLLVKNTGYYGQAVTKNTLAANTNGWFEYVLRGMNQLKSIGFLDSLGTRVNDDSDIDYGFYYDGSNNYLYVMIGGSYSLVSGQTAEGSVLRVERVGSTINFKVNGAIVQSVVSAADAAKAWKIKTLINAYNNGSMINVGCSFYQKGNATFKNYLRLSPTVVHTSSLSATDGSIKVKASQAGSTYTYTWQPGSVASATLSTKAAGAYSLTAADALGNKTPYAYNIGYKCDWDKVYAGLSRNDSLIGRVNGIGSYAISKNTLAANTDGWVEYIFKNPEESKIFGFTDSISPFIQWIEDVDYGFSYYADSKIAYIIYKGGYAGGVYVNDGDILRIEKTGNIFYYKLNGQVVGSYTSTADAAKAWKVKGFTYNTGTLVNLGCSFYQKGNTVFPNYTRLNPTIVHSSFNGANDGSVSVKSIMSGACTYTWQPGALASATLTGKPAGTYSVTVEDAIHTKNTLSYHIGYKVAWDSLMGCIGKKDTLLGNGVYTWGRGMSKNSLPGGTDGWLEYVLKDSSEVKFVGFLDSLSPVANTFGDIDFGFYCQGNGYLYIVNHGSLSYAAPYHEGTLLRIERMGNTINYLVDGTIVSTLVDALETQKTWRIKGVLGAYTTNPTLRNVGCSFNTPFAVQMAKSHASVADPSSGIIALSVSGGVPPYAYHWSKAGAEGNLQTGLEPGNYSVIVTDSLNDSLTVTTSIGLQNNWRMYRNINVTDTGYVKTNADTTSAAALISHNVIPASTNGFCEMMVTEGTNNVAFGFVGFAENKLLSNYSSPMVRQGAIDTTLVFADSLLMSGKINSPSAQRVSGEYKRLNLIYFKDGIVTIGFKDYTMPVAGPITYTQGDIFKMQRYDNVIALYKNEQLIAQNNITGNNSQYLLNGVFVTKGSAMLKGSASLSFGPSPIKNADIPNFTCDYPGLNWVQTRTFDENGVIKSDSKTYMDNLGRTVQNQSKILSRNNVLVSEPMYDSFGRAVGQSLPAPSFNSELCYVPAFIEHSPGMAYTPDDFDNLQGVGVPGDVIDAFNTWGDVNNPKPVNNTNQGKLGWYYSNNNTAEPLVAADNLPYARVEFYDDGRVRRSAGTGSTLKMGSGHETHFIYTSTPDITTDPASNELNYVFPNRTYELEKDFTVWPNAINLNLQLFKTISISADGKDQITYTNGAGQTIATCITGDGSGCVTHQELKIFYLNSKQEKVQEIYIPKNKAGTFRFLTIDNQSPPQPTSTPTNAIPVLKDLMKNVVLVSGTDYTFNASTGYFTFLGNYANKSLYLQVTYVLTTPLANTLAISAETDYTQWTLYFYDRKGRLLANASPNDVVCQSLPVVAQKVSVDGNAHDPCNGGQVARIQLNSTVTASSGIQAFMSFEQVGGSIFTLTDPVPQNKFVLQTAAQKYVQDSIYFANDTLVRDTIAVINPLDSINRFANMGLPTDEALGFYRQLDSLETQVPLNALAGKRITYTGEYTIYKKMRGSTAPGDLVATVPYDFTIEGSGELDNSGGAIIKVTSGKPKRPILLPFTDPTNVDEFTVGMSNPKINVIGFGIDPGTNLGSCSNGPYISPGLIPILNAMNQGPHPHIVFGALIAPTPINIPLANKYMYDAYDRLVGSVNEDQGAVDYVYDQAEDKLLFTQNDKQRANGGKFSCIVYDKLGRPVISGEYDPLNGGPTSGNVPFQFQNYYDHKNGLPVASGRMSTGVAAYANNTSMYNDGHIFDRTFIEYDNADASLPTNMGSLFTYKQTYTAAKVSKTWNNQTTTWYSYDELGRQNWSVQNSAALGYKTMNYAYTMQGNLITSGYQVGGADNRIHTYTYDADNRLSAAYSGVFTTATQNTYLKPLASYSYYLHGPLKRTVLGNHLQGLDYVYTIDGKLKSVNNPLNSSTSADPGLDGYSTGPNPTVSPDAFSYALEYYPGDYARSGSPIASYNFASAYNDDNTSYTGIIKANSWRTTLPSGAPANYSAALMYEYNYDELYRLTGAQFGTITGPYTSGGAHPVVTHYFDNLPEYRLENMSYDQNGNLQTLKRYAAPINSTTAHLLDNLSYNYSSTHKNSLRKITDAATNTAGYTADLDLPNQTNSANYVYNQIGELVANTQENKGFEYNAQGLTTRVYQLGNSNNIATYTYNDKGLRHCKTSYNNAGVAIKNTYYSYDAGGMQVASYVQDLSSPALAINLQDQSLYAAGRVGMYDAATATVMYELTDHLGNTRAVVAANATTGAAETVSYTDYFPHGSVMPGRTYQSSLNFPYGYQGQEKDAETGLTNFELRQYDGRIGRWYNPDPMGQHHSPYLAMGNNPVSSIDPDGGWDVGPGGGNGGKQYTDQATGNGINDRLYAANGRSSGYRGGDGWINNMEGRANFNIDMSNYLDYKAKHTNAKGEWGYKKTVKNYDTRLGETVSETFVVDPTKKIANPRNEKPFQSALSNYLQEAFCLPNDVKNEYNLRIKIEGSITMGAQLGNGAIGGGMKASIAKFEQELIVYLSKGEIKVGERTTGILGGDGDSDIGLYFEGEGLILKGGLEVGFKVRGRDSYHVANSTKAEINLAFGKGMVAYILKYDMLTNKFTSSIPSLEFLNKKATIKLPDSNINGSFISGGSLNIIPELYRKE